MRIKRFKFDDLRTGWHLEETVFDPFNLLVGVSGVGKTKILDALQRVCMIATEGEYNPGEVEWAIEFEHDGQTYQWEGRTEPLKDGAFPEDEAAAGNSTDADGSTRIAREKIESAAGILVERDGKAFAFEGTSLPRLKRASSAIVLLEDEKSISPIRDGFRRILRSKATDARPFSTSHAAISDSSARLTMYRALSKDPDGFTQFRKTLARAGLSKISEHAPLAAYYLQKAFAAQFQELKEIFVDIFASVQNLNVSTSNEAYSGGARLELTIQERGNSAWIRQGDISSGMLRTLVHLIELSLAPPGSVIVIDEFENSLGVNCMPQLSDLILSRASDLQFIITSHHPYIINKIPPETWKLVTRKDGHVRVTSAKDIPSLQKISHQQAFIRLINLPEFEEGIS